MVYRGIYSSIICPKHLGITFSLWGRIPSLREKEKKKLNYNNGKKKKKKKKKKKAAKIQKIICREGFVEILHFEGGRILPSVGKGRVVFWGEGEGCTLSI